MSGEIHLVIQPFHRDPYLLFQVYVPIMHFQSHGDFRGIRRHSSSRMRGCGGEIEGSRRQSNLHRDTLCVTALIPSSSKFDTSINGISILREQNSLLDTRKLANRIRNLLHVAFYKSKPLPFDKYRGIRDRINCRQI